jgi:small ligand-binding sensory domain FIST
VTQEDLESPDPGETIRGRVGAAGKGGPQAFLLLADPYSIDGEALLAALEDAAPGRPVLGGFASGAGAPRGHALWLSREVHRDGAVGLAVDGAVRVAPLVSQGCRPIGRRFTVTKASGQRIATLAGKPAVEALREVLEGLGAEDRDLARTGLHLGRAAIEAKAEFGRGDFLVRNIVGVVPEDGSLVVGDHVEVGQTVQFQLRDAASATEDLSLLLDGQSSSGKPGAALLFSCGGRGARMFGRRDHDLGLVREKLGDVPVAGFFCNGEIGPVGSRSFLHGFTSSLAIFRAP